MPLNSPHQNCSVEGRRATVAAPEESYGACARTRTPRRPVSDYSRDEQGRSSGLPTQVCQHRSANLEQRVISKNDVPVSGMPVLFERWNRLQADRTSQEQIEPEPRHSSDSRPPRVDLNALLADLQQQRCMPGDISSRHWSPTKPFSQALTDFSSG